MGLINLGVQLGTTGVVAYVVDCHREQASEAFAAMNVSFPNFWKGWCSERIRLLPHPVAPLSPLSTPDISLGKDPI